MPTTVEEELLALEARLDEARMRGDGEMFANVLAEDFRTTNPVGAVTGKQQALDDAKSGRLKVHSSRSTGIVVRPLSPGVAVVTGRADMRAEFRGYDISGAFMYTHVYVRRDDGRWQVVTAHTSRLMPDWLYLIAIKVANLFRLAPR